MMQIFSTTTTVMDSQNSLMHVIEN